MFYVGLIFLFPIGLIIFVGDGNKMIMDYVNLFSMEGDWNVGQNGGRRNVVVSLSLQLETVDLGQGVNC